MNIYCRNTIYGLKPLYDSDFNEKKRLKLNCDYVCEIKIPRNYEFHKKYFSLLNIAFENLPESYPYKNLDELRHAIQLECGYYQEIVLLSGEIIKQPLSISFSKMDNLEFEKLYNATLNVILKYILIGTEKEEIAMYVAENM